MLYIEEEDLLKVIYNTVIKIMKLENRFSSSKKLDRN